MNILGVDPGLASCGWALLDSVTARVRACDCIRTHKSPVVGDFQSRIAAVLDQLETLVAGTPLIVIEFPAGGGAGSAGRTSLLAARQVVAVAGAVMGLARAGRGAVLTPAPLTWRTALGCVRGSDAALHAQLAECYPRTIDRLRAGAQPHVLDAIGLALYGRATASNLSIRRRVA